MINNYIELSPVEQVSTGLYLKRDDLFQPLSEINVNGTKLRECICLIQNNMEQCRKNGVVTGTSIHSPQSIIVAGACKLLGVPCTCIFGGTSVERLKQLGLYGALISLGATVEIPCKCGRTTVLQSYINKRIIQTGEFCVRYGIKIMQDSMLIEAVSNQVQNLPKVPNLCMVCGSGITTIGVLNGLNTYNKNFSSIYLFGTAPNREKMIYSHYGGKLFTTNKHIHNIHYIDLHSEDGFVYENKEYQEIDGYTFHPQYEAKAYKRLSELGLNNSSTVFYVIGQEIDLRRFMDGGNVQLSDVNDTAV